MSGTIPQQTIPRCIHQLFEAQVERTPLSVAVVFESEQLTYRQLNNRANQLAYYLRDLGVGPEVLVGICVERSIEMVVGLLGILKAGGAYVPLDPNYPQERLAYMLGDSAVPVLLTQSNLVEQLPKTEAQLVCLDSQWEAISLASAETPINQTKPNHLAYINYTSGSTGKPKGVAVIHQGVIRLLFGVNYVNLSASKKILQAAPISFDAATFEIWGALLHGAQCVLFPAEVPTAKDLSDAIEKYGITTLWLTAALFNSIIDDRPSTFREIRQLLTGGETLSVKHIQKALAALPSVQIINGYSPTESTTFTCCYLIPQKSSDA